MAIKHKTGFLPPVLKLPLEYNPNKNVGHLLDVIGRKYGLHATGLRQLVCLNDYHCVELELHGTGDRPLEAVWVGLEDYIRIRGTDQFGFDPLAKWLHEKNSGVVPATRPAWEKTGWFKGASAWIHHQLDHLNIQATGAVSQFNAFRRRSEVLNVPTSAGKLFFKATYIRKPLEVPLTLALARHWPLNTPQLLAFDEKRNWMLMRDAKEAEKHSYADADYTAAASAMARIQVESLENLTEWTELGCAPTGLDQLRAFWPSRIGSARYRSLIQEAWTYLMKSAQGWWRLGPDWSICATGWLNTGFPRRSCIRIFGGRTLSPTRIRSGSSIGATARSATRSFAFAGCFSWLLIAKK